MYNWAMCVWNMPANDFILSFLKWFVVVYVYYQIHIEISMWRMRRMRKLAKDNFKKLSRF